MKYFFYLIFTLLLVPTAWAQSDCTPGRYTTEYFDDFEVAHNIAYRYAEDNDGNWDSLHYDLYEPKGDTATERPLIVLAFGGTFTDGDKSSPDIVYLSEKLAAQGYVVAAMNYRIGVDLGNILNLDEEFKYAAWRGLQDMRAFVRYIRYHIAESGNPHKIANDKIFIGGVSSGSVVSLHAAFIDYEDDIPQEVDTLKLGGIDQGDFKNYSPKPNGVINLCGAIFSLDYIANGPEVPMFHMHGSLDDVMPYRQGNFEIFGQTLAYLYGSYSIDSFAVESNLKSELYTFKLRGHVPWSEEQELIDTVRKHTGNFVYSQLVCAPKTSITPKSTIKTLSFYPNPATHSVQVDNIDGRFDFRIVDINGTVIEVGEGNHGKITWKRNLPMGIYVLQAIDKEGNTFQNRLMISNSNEK